MLRKIKIITLLMIMSTGLAVQSGCHEDTSSNDTFQNILLLQAMAPRISGYWKSGYGDGFEFIDLSGTPMFYQYDNAGKDISFAGEIVSYQPGLDGSGYIYIKITDAGTWNKAVGKYYTAHLQDYTGNETSNTIAESTAYKDPYGDPNNDGQAALNEAVALYTVANGYFDMHSTYTKQ